MPHLYSAAALSEEGRADGSARREDPDANSMSSSLTKNWKYVLLGALALGGGAVMLSQPVAPLAPASVTPVDTTIDVEHAPVVSEDMRRAELEWEAAHSPSVAAAGPTATTYTAYTPVAPVAAVTPTSATSIVATAWQLEEKEWEARHASGAAPAITTTAPAVMASVAAAPSQPADSSLELATAHSKIAWLEAELEKARSVEVAAPAAEFDIGAYRAERLAATPPNIIECAEAGEGGSQEACHLPSSERFAALGQKGVTLWMTGLSGSGKSTIARALEEELVKKHGKHVQQLDGDNVRTGLNRDLGFSPDDRAESVRRVGEMACLFNGGGVITLVTLVSPYREDREEARRRHEEQGLPFLEVYMHVPIEVVQARDPKGLYAKVAAGEITSFTGMSADAPYEEPLAAEVGLSRLVRLTVTPGEHSFVRTNNRLTCATISFRSRSACRCS
jgi:adenylyl-sulfate kinase